ncbi:hypothetical protein [Clostridium sp.]|uniref:hypothetical protein n=1 Tax=Clostridium sp. TaxID=1506 RepID=UPI002FDCB73B
MKDKIEGTKRAEINMHFSEFEMPPMQDILIVGKNAPIGPEAARRMVDVLSPEQYDIIKIEHNYIEAIVVRKSLLNMLSEDKLIPIIMEEGGKIANESIIVKAQVNIILHVSKSVDL